MRGTTRGSLCLLVLAVIVGGVAVSSAQKASAPGRAPALTLEVVARNWDAFVGMAPAQVRWAPDGKALYFDWNPERADTASPYALAIPGGQPRKLTPEEVRLVPPPEARGSHSVSALDTSHDGSLVAFQRQGDIFLLQVRTGKVTRITNTEAAEQNPRVTHDLATVTFESGGNLFAHDVATGALTQVTNFRAGQAPGRPPNEQEKYLQAQQLELFAFVQEADRLAKEQGDRSRREKGPRPAPTALTATQNVEDMELSPDRQFVTFNLVDGAREALLRKVEYPDYVNRTGYVEMRNQSGGGPVKVAEAYREYRLGIMTVADGKVRYVDSSQFGKPVAWNTILWSQDGKHAVAWVGSEDHRDLWLCAIDVKAAAAKVLFHEHDDAWVRGFRAGRLQRGDGLATGFLPDGRTAFFLSEQDGWYHLYTVGTEGESLRQLTKGAFELTRPTLSKDGTRWYFISNEGDLFEQHLDTMPLAGGPRTRLTKVGWCEDYAVSPDDTKIAFLYQDPSTPTDLYLMDSRPGAEPQPLTASRTEEFKKYVWQVPEYVTFPDKDGWQVHGELYKPARPHPLHPAIIRVYGGWAHETGRQFGNSALAEVRPEFQYYVDHGYTVLSIDAKASRGYGRESRTAVYMQIEKPALESLDAAVEYLVTKCRVDRKRIGVYGHSQGGFTTLMAILKRPGVFAAGVAQAPPTDTAHGPTLYYNARVLTVPWKAPDAYRSGSPINFADKLQDRLLILHGINDSNVPIQESFRFVQRLIELKKTGWELAVYPVEGHIPRTEASRLDMARRRFALFESVLKAPPAGRRTATAR
ncbi:MAG: prolyl oligopeptidase family serine peptidase [Acidobacteria bacterium]|nr:prolyl oligopeptidase family serine peptidase [Acidobacteriota bacterium]